jgi:hypothetical protein
MPRRTAPDVASLRETLIHLQSMGLPAQRGISAIFHKEVRGGDWTVPQFLRVFVLGGQSVLDLRFARFHPGITEIEVLSIMGETKITLPHGLHVESFGSAALGQFSLKHTSDGVPQPDAPIVRVRGQAVMGTVLVRVVDPDVPHWTDKVRAYLSGK